MKRIFVVAMALMCVRAAAAQEPDPLSPLPDSVAERAVALYNEAETIRLAGDATLAAGGSITGNVGVLGGPVVLAGRIDGSLVVINGDLTLGAGAQVTGNVIALGGTLTLAPEARVGGRLVHYREALRYTRSGDIIEREPPDAAAEFVAGREFDFGRTDLVVAVRGGYNRTEGLPVSAGPRVRLGHSNPTVLEALAIYRTVGGLDPDENDIGWALKAEQHFGGRGTIRAGLSWYSEFAAVEDWGLTDRENSLATVLLHIDHRDHYEREGWSAYVTGRPWSSARMTVGYRNELHRSAPVEDPPAVFGEGPWRPQPLIDEGRLHSAFAAGVYDTRNESRDPSAGWLIRGELEVGLGGSLARPVAADFEQEDVLPARPAEESFSAALLDIRRYARFTPYSFLAVRLLAAGSLDGGRLPAQRQHALGGEGSLPGYDRFEFDCGARREQIIARGSAYHPFYGCDRMALVQLEYQAGFPFARRLTERLGLHTGHAVRWVAFFDAGRAWTEPESRDGRRGGQSDFAADAGVGVRLGGVGLYWAFPVSAGADGVNFFVRLGRRF